MNAKEIEELLKENQDYVVCPHCFDLIEIIQLNCQIFRHSQLLSPHATEEQCTTSVNDIVICSKPFKVVINENGVKTAIKCEYI
jgi:hypothetical protein